MILSKLYADKKFKLVSFDRGFSQIKGMAPGVLREILHHCFLLEHNLGPLPVLYRQSTFYLELEFSPTRYVTIRRTPEDKVALALHEKKLDFLSSKNSDWYFIDSPLSSGRLQLNELCDFKRFMPWGYGHPVSYALRNRLEGTIFRPGVVTFHDGEPYLFKALGLDDKLRVAYSETFTQCMELSKKDQETLKGLGEYEDSIDRLEGMIAIARHRVETMPASRGDAAPPENVQLSVLLEKQKRLNRWRSIHEKSGRLKKLLAEYRLEMVQDFLHASYEGIYPSIKFLFYDFVREMINREVVLYGRMIDDGHPVIDASFLGANEWGSDDVYHYRRLLALSLDLAFCLYYGHDSYPCFICDDGDFSDYNPPIRSRLRDYIETHSIQYFVSEK